MKKLSLLLVSALAFLGCSADNGNFTVSGTTETDAQKVYFLMLGERAPFDSANVKNTKFQKVIKANPQSLVQVITDNRFHQMFFVDGSSVEVNVVTDELKGTGLNQKLNEALKGYRKITDEMTQLENQYRKLMETQPAGYEAKVAELEKKGEAINLKLMEWLKYVCKNNKTNMMPVAAINIFPPYYFTYEDLVEIMPEDAAYTEHPALAELKEMMKSLALRAKGKMFTDAEIPDADGNMRKLSDYIGKGKYVLVDFWASWCGPCCREMPNVVAAYEKYKDKGFEVVGISLDRSKEAWLKTISDLGMTWPQLSDLKFWQCEAARMYGVTAIPSNILFDKEGRVLDSNLTGEKLQETLAEIFK